MKFPTVGLYFLMITPIIFVEADLDPEGENVCLKTITYTETIHKTTPAPPKKPCNKSCKCVKCKKNHCQTAAAEAKNPQVITRSKIVADCCEGYKKDPKGVKCLPVCAEGCGNGTCIAPEKCSCDSGFFGAKCNQNCDEGKWGKNCVLDCKCSENEVCDKFVGCICKPGWKGDKCATSCPQGYYGLKCVEKCDCGNDPCDSVTGDCIEMTEPLPAVKNEENEIKEPESESSNGVNETLHHVQNHLDEDSNVAKDGGNLVTTIPNFFQVQKSEKQTEVENSFSGKKSQEQPKTNDSFTSEVEVFKEIITNITGGDIYGGQNDSSNSDSHSFENNALKTSGGGNFVPTIAVLSTAFLLMFFIGGKWLITNFLKKSRLARAQAGCFDAEFGLIRNEDYIFRSDKGTADYAFDSKIKRAQSSESFMFPSVQIENIFTEKKQHPNKGSVKCIPA